MSAIALELPEEIEAIRDGLVAFARAEVLPRHERNRALFENPRRLYREDGRLGDEVLALIREVRMAAAEAGYFTMCVPEALGGGGHGMLAYYAGWEELFRTSGPANWLMLYAISHWALGPSRLLEKVTPEAREEILQPLMRGEKSMCFGLSEPGAGSDAAALQTKAVPDGDGWRISGRKIWTTNSPVADYCIVFAVTEPERAAQRKGGISAFLVPTDAPGFNVERIGNTARALALGRHAYEIAREHAMTRTQFGRPLCEFQGLQWKFADMKMNLDAGHLLLYRAAANADNGFPSAEETSIAKAFCNRVGFETASEAMQILGGAGYSGDSLVEYCFRRTRGWMIAGGSPEMMKNRIAEVIFERRFSQRPPKAPS